MITTLPYYKEITPPAEMPVTLSELKLALRIRDEVTEEDNLLNGLLMTAIIFGENYSRRQFVQRDWQAFFPCMESSSFESYPFIQIDRAPINDIPDLYVFYEGSYQIMDPETYIYKPSNGFPRILFSNIPNFDVGSTFILRADFSSGYGAAADVPETFKTAIKEHVAFLYENRGDVQAIGKERLPEQIKALYQQFRIMNTF